MNEYESRLRQMTDAKQQTWDLSPNDAAAIRWALEEIERLAKMRAACEAFVAWDDNTRSLDVPNYLRKMFDV